MATNAAINKIHINNSTKMTLSDRFTAFSSKPKIQPRATNRGIDSPVSRVASIANRRLLKQLAQKHTREAALRLKRRSMKPRATTTAYARVLNGVPLKRGSIKALRLGPSGRLMKANSITDVATMEADLLGRAPRRSNSTSRMSDRIGPRRNGGPIGQGPRRAARPIWRPNARTNNFNRTPPPPQRMRSRSRSLNRRSIPSPPTARARIGQRITRPRRANSRSRPMIRSRSRSNRNDRSILVQESPSSSSVPITSRLGRRTPIRSRSASRSNRGRMGTRGLSRGGVASGRIQKRRNSVKAVTTRGASLAGGRLPNRMNRARGTNNNQRAPPPGTRRLNTQFPKNGGSVARGGRARSRSRADNRPLQKNNGIVRGGATNRQRGRGAARGRGNGRRGRSQQRGGTSGPQRNGQQQQQQQRRGRSRSRGRGSARGGRQLATDKPDVKKEDLDKELDQYMSSTKTNDGGFP